MDTVVLATRNKGKIKELRALLRDQGLNVLGLDDFPHVEEVEETGTTFVANARLKAVAVAQATGLPAMADDSGLEVDALNGGPGVYSARYAADDPGNDPDLSRDVNNCRKLLRELEGVPEARRTARFRCVMVAHAPSGAEITADGAWEGRIAETPVGDNGFGYDPVFFDPELGRTAATLSREDKNARSHRGKALTALLAQWPEFWQQFKKAPIADISGNQHTMEQGIRPKSRPVLFLDGLRQVPFAKGRGEKIAEAIFMTRRVRISGSDFGKSLDIV